MTMKALAAQGKEGNSFHRAPTVKCEHPPPQQGSSDSPHFLVEETEARRSLATPESLPDPTCPQGLLWAEPAPRSPTEAPHLGHHLPRPPG